MLVPSQLPNVVTCDVWAGQAAGDLSRGHQSPLSSAVSTWTLDTCHHYIQLNIVNTLTVD